MAQKELIRITIIVNSYYPNLESMNLTNKPKLNVFSPDIKGIQHHKHKLSREVAVLIVSFESRNLTATYLQDSTITWRMIIDEQRQLYNTYHMDRTSFGIYGTTRFLAYLKQLLKGNAPKAPLGDVN